MDFTFLSRTPLFRGILPEEIESMLSCLNAVEKHYKRGEVIYYAGDVIRSLGIVLSGRVSVESDDVWGNRNILSHVGPGHVFAETYACIPGETLMVHVVAVEDSTILFLDAEQIFETCQTACGYHNKLIRNMMFIFAQKNLNLSRKIFHTSPKSIRGRVLSFLSEQATRSGSNSLTFQFNRQQLADYLNVDRSSLSNELGKMQADGFIQVEKNHFTLLDKDQ